MRSEQPAAQAETRRFYNHVFGCGLGPVYDVGPGYRMVRCGCSFLAWRPR